MQRITPYVLYEDAGAAVDWLCAAFGFTERLRFPEPDGTVSHAEVEMDGAVVMLGAPGGDYQSPARSGHATQMVYVEIDNVDGHCDRARSAGATIVEEPNDKPYGYRSYAALDLEGHRWDFGKPTADVAPEDWGAVAPDPG